MMDHDYGSSVKLKLKSSKFARILGIWAIHLLLLIELQTSFENHLKIKEIEGFL